MSDRVGVGDAPSVGREILIAEREKLAGLVPEQVTNPLVHVFDLPVEAGDDDPIETRLEEVLIGESREPPSFFGLSSLVDVGDRPGESDRATRGVVLTLPAREKPSIAAVCGAQTKLGPVRLAVFDRPFDRFARRPEILGV